MLNNGGVTLGRIIGSTIVTICCIAVAGVLSVNSLPIPFEIVTIAAVGIGGVVGVDVVAEVVKARVIK